MTGCIGIAVHTCKSSNCQAFIDSTLCHRFFLEVKLDGKKCELGSSVIIVAVEDKWNPGKWNLNIKVHIAALCALAKSALIREGTYLLIQSCSNFHQMFTAAQRLNQTLVRKELSPYYIEILLPVSISHC